MEPLYVLKEYKKVKSMSQSNVNKQIYAVLSLVAGLLGFNLIAIAQTMNYMRIKHYMKTTDIVDFAPMIATISGEYKMVCFALGLAALVFCYLYTKSPENNARLFNSLGGILGLITVILSWLPIYLWLI